MDLMRFHRRKRLPNETGGVLLGAIDHQQRTVYVATVLPSPSDSTEWPTAYIRGVKGLKETVEKAQAMSGGDLSYVGEWHSHPQGCNSAPSEDDRKAHQWLVGEMMKVGLPGVVFIQGEEREPTILIEPQ